VRHAPAQMDMGSDPGAVASGSSKKTTALQALQNADLICKDYVVEGYDKLAGLIKGEYTMAGRVCRECITCPCCVNCFCQCHYFEVDNGCIRSATSGDGVNIFYGPGVHAFFGLCYSLGDTYRVAEVDAVVNGTCAIITVKQGYVGLAMKKGEPILLPPGLHQWDDPDINFEKLIDLSSSLITMGPYTLVTVEEGYAAITQDNGKQTVLPGGNSYMLTHQNWKFQAWLSLKMQTNKVGPLSMTTGDNIALNIIANVNWVIVDAVVAAGKNVDLNNGNDTLKLMRDDVNLQVTSSLASLVGAIRYGGQGTEGIQKAARTGQVPRHNEVPLPGAVNDEEAAAPEPDPEDEKLGRKALWDPMRLASAVEDANNICSRYGVEILSINLISAAPADQKLVEIMSRGAVATVSAEETAKAARAEANASLIAAEAETARARAAAEALQIKARSEADATTIAVQGEAARAQSAADALLVKSKAEAESLNIKAKAEAEAERVRAEGAKEAGLLIGESDVATSLAKLKITYEPFNKSNSFFFGLQGPGDLPKAILGKQLAAEADAAGIGMSVAAASTLLG